MSDVVKWIDEHDVPHLLDFDCLFDGLPRNDAYFKNHLRGDGHYILAVYRDDRVQGYLCYEEKRYRLQVTRYVTNDDDDEEDDDIAYQFTGQLFRFLISILPPGRNIRIEVEATSEDTRTLQFFQRLGFCAEPWGHGRYEDPFSGNYRLCYRSSRSEQVT